MNRTKIIGIALIALISLMTVVPVCSSAESVGVTTGYITNINYSVDGLAYAFTINDAITIQIRNPNAALTLFLKKASNNWLPVQVIYEQGTNYLISIKIMISYIDLSVQEQDISNRLLILCEIDSSVGPNMQ